MEREPQPGRLKALVLLPDLAYRRTVEGLVDTLTSAGHQVEVELEQGGGLPRQHGPWPIAASAVRRSLDYLRYLEPDRAAAEPLRDRARTHAPRAVKALLALPPLRRPLGRRALAWTLRRIEAGLPISRDVKTFVAGRRPDVVVVSRLVELGSTQADYARAAQAAGIPSVLVSTPAVNDARDAIERAARVEAVDRPPGRILRPVLLLLTPLLTIALLVARPSTIGRAARTVSGRVRSRANRRAKEAKAERAAAVRQHKLERARVKEQRREAQKTREKPLR